MTRLFLLVLVLASAAPAAHAMRPPRPPTPLYPPGLNTPQSALSDTWTLTCQSRTASHCKVHGLFVFARPTAAPARLQLGNAGVLTIDRVLLDGAPVQADQDGTLPIEPGENPVTVELFAAVPILGASDSAYVIPAIHARHLAAHVGRNRSHFAYAVHTADAASQHPSAYTHDVQVETAGGLRAHTARHTAPRDDGAAESTEVTLTHPGSRAHFGGPMLGLGGSTGHNAHFRMRTGLEMGWSTWGLASLAFDTDFRSSHVLAPQVEFSTPSLLYIPLSLTAGAGLPVQLGDDKRIGARFNVGLHFLVLGLVTSFDLWPGRPTVTRRSWPFSRCDR
ncbi:MAG: hypothetical protein R3F39_23480 [Myxococcota bacterium]